VWTYLCGHIYGNVDIYIYRCVDIYSVCVDLYMGYLYVCISYVFMYMYIHRVCMCIIYTCVCTCIYIEVIIALECISGVCVHTHTYIHTYELHTYCVRTYIWYPHSEAIMTSMYICVFVYMYICIYM